MKEKVKNKLAPLEAIWLSHPAIVIRGKEVLTTSRIKKGDIVSIENGRPSMNPKSSHVVRGVFGTLNSRVLVIKARCLKTDEKQKFKL